MAARHLKILLVFAFFVANSFTQMQNVGYLLLTPKIIYAGEQNKLFLQIENATVDGKISLTVHEKYNDSITHLTKDFNIPVAEGPLYQLDISDIQVEWQYTSERYFKGVFNGVFGTFTFTQNISMKIHPQNTLVLTQLDKYIYKPGQKVNIRVLVMDYNLKPISKGTISIQVSDSNSNVVAVWKEISLEDLIVQFDFTLSDEPPMGKWTVRVYFTQGGLLHEDRTEWTYFTVTEYTLPKFEVKITPPPFVHADAKTIKYNICANYTFGKPVVGTLKINTTLRRDRWDKGMLPEIYEEKKINGCLDYIVDTSNLTEPKIPNRDIRVFAEVSEENAKDQINATVRTSRTNQPVKLNFLQDSNDKYFRAYMNTYGSLKVTLPDDTPAANELIELCLVATSQRYTYEHQRTDVRKMCKNYTSDSTGMINYTIPPHKRVVVSFVVNAKALNHPNMYYPYNEKYLQTSQPTASTTYKAFYSQTGRFVQFEPLPDTKVSCNSSAKLSAFYVFKDGDTNLKFKYIVMARSVNIISQTIDVAEPRPVEPSTSTGVLIQNRKNVFSDMATESDSKIGRIDFEINPNSTQLPQLTVLLYYISGTEIIIDSIKVNMEVCSKNKVDLVFSEEVIQPGDYVGVTISGSPASRCGYDIIDKSVALLIGDNGSPFDQYNNKLPHREIWLNEEPGPDKRSCRFWGYTYAGDSHYVDGEVVILNSGWNYISNMDVFTRRCNGIKSSVAGYAGAYAPGESETESKVDVRHYFPESWLFSLVSLDSSGKFFKNLSAPHTVTTWNANAICINKEDGLGVSDSKEVKTFQAFFAEVRLPYSVKRGENLAIIINTFNYLPKCMPVNIKVDPLPGVEVSEDTQLTIEACICSDTSPFHHEVKVTVTNQTQIGDLNVTVTATNSNNMSVCSGKPGAKSVPSRDKIRRHIKVVPEGFNHEVSTSHLLCPKLGKGSQVINLTVPENIINGSAISLFTVSGDVVSQSLSNVDSLFEYGLGDRSYLQFVSTQTIFDYLEYKKLLEPKMKKLLQSHLKSGYLHLISYRKKDGSFPLFRGDEGQSTFLTATVYQGLRQANRTLYIDLGYNKTLKYLLDAQNNNTGCFESTEDGYGYLSRNIQFGATSAFHTAHVIAALGVGTTEATVINKAFLCIAAQKNMDTQSLALAAYASAIFKKNDLAKMYLGRLEKFAHTINQNEKFYSKDGAQFTPDALLTSAYAILGTLELEGAAAVEKVQPVVKWLMKGGNINGGFGVPFGTLIGTVAVLKFATLIDEEPSSKNIRVKVNGEKGFNEDYHITKDNAIVWDTRIVKTIPDTLTVTTEGTGCVVLTSQLRYNTLETTDYGDFNVDIAVSNKSTVKNVALNICISYKGAQPSHVTVVNLELLSGYSADRLSLNKLVKSKKVQQYETPSGRIVLYLYKYGSKTKCLKVNTKRDFEVNDLKAATITVSDLYDENERNSKFYERGPLPSDADNVLKLKA